MTGLLGTLALLASASPGALPLAPCTLSHPGLPLRVDARCGTLEVPEDRASPAGRRIALAVAVLRAQAQRAQADPVFVLAGGPGQAIRETFPVLADRFVRLGYSRDVVLVDQRGTGGSGRLDCPSLSPGGRGPLEPGEEVAAVAACARSLRADLSKYRTDDFVADLEAVRAALGYERVNVIGFSYGTRAALTWLRAHPERIRSLVLDGAAPFQLAVGGHFEEDGQRALDLLFERCAGDPRCRGAFPDLASELRAVAARLGRQPARVRTRHPRTGAPLEARFGLDELRAVVTSFLYSPVTVAGLPPMIHAAAQGDYAPLAAMGLVTSGDLEAGLSRPLQLSVLCAEDVPFVEDGPRPPATARLLGGAVHEAYRRLCAAWPVRPVDAAWRAPVRSQVPALLLSGEADPVTPPRWAALLAEDLPNARHVVVPGGGHGVYGTGCVSQLVFEFIDAGSAAGIDARCAEEVPPQLPFIDFAGGPP